MAKTCCFLARQVDEFTPVYVSNEASIFCIKFKSDLKNLLTTLVADGYRRFLTGMESGVDILFAEVCLALRDENTDKEICVEAYISYGLHHLGISQSEAKKYFVILEKLDNINLVSMEYTDTCLSERNNQLLAESQSVITDDTNYVNQAQRIFYVTY